MPSFRAVETTSAWAPDSSAMPSSSREPPFRAAGSRARAGRGGCFELLGIAEESGAHAEVVSTARKLGINYPVLFDDDAKVGDAFRIPGYPRTYLVDVS